MHIDDRGHVKASFRFNWDLCGGAHGSWAEVVALPGPASKESCCGRSFSFSVFVKVPLVVKFHFFLF